MRLPGARAALGRACLINPEDLAAGALPVAGTGEDLRRRELEGENGLVVERLSHFAREAGSWAWGPDRLTSHHPLGRGPGGAPGSPVEARAVAPPG